MKDIKEAYTFLWYTQKILHHKESPHLFTIPDRFIYILNDVSDGELILYLNFPALDGLRKRSKEKTAGTKGHS